MDNNCLIEEHNSQADKSPRNLHLALQRSEEEGESESLSSPSPIKFNMRRVPGQRRTAVNKSLTIQHPDAKFAMSQRNVLPTMMTHDQMKKTHSLASNGELTARTPVKSGISGVSRARKSLDKKKMVRRLSAGVNFFLNQMKFKTIDETSGLIDEPNINDKPKSPIKEVSNASSYDETSLDGESSSEEKDIVNAQLSIADSQEFTVPLKSLSINQLSQALTGQSGVIDPMLVQQQDQDLVRPGRNEGQEYIDVYSPRGQHKIRIFKSVNKQINIVSRFIKRMELEHIEDQIDYLNVVPDFGYQTLLRDSSSFRGWDMLRDFIQNSAKYERLENYIQMRQYVNQEKQKLEQERMRQKNRRETKMLQAEIQNQMNHKILDTITHKSNASKKKGEVAAGKKRIQMQLDLMELFEMQKKAQEYLARFRRKFDARQEKLKSVQKKKEEKEQLSKQRFSRSPTLNSKNHIETHTLDFSQEKVSPAGNYQRQSTIRMDPRGSVAKFHFQSPQGHEPYLRKQTMMQKSFAEEFQSLGKFKEKLGLPGKEEQKFGQTLRLSQAFSPRMKGDRTLQHQTRGNIEAGMGGFSDLIMQTKRQDDEHSRRLSRVSENLGAFLGAARKSPNTKLSSLKEAKVSIQHSPQMSSKSFRTEFYSSQEDDEQYEEIAEQLETPRGKNGRPTLTDREVKLFELLKKAYQATVKELIHLCIKVSKPTKPPEHHHHKGKKKAHIHISGVHKKHRDQSPDQDVLDQQEIIQQNILKLQNEKINIGQLLRIVTGSKYEKLSDSLKEIEVVEQREPAIKKFVGHLERKRDLSKKRNEEQLRKVSRTQQKFYSAAGRSPERAHKTTIESSSTKKLPQQRNRHLKALTTSKPPEILLNHDSQKSLPEDVSIQHEIKETEISSMTQPTLATQKKARDVQSLYLKPITNRSKAKAGDHSVSPQKQNGPRPFSPTDVNQDALGIAIELGQTYTLGETSPLDDFPRDKKNQRKLPIKKATFNIDMSKTSLGAFPPLKQQKTPVLSRALQQSMNSYKNVRPYPSKKADTSLSQLLDEELTKRKAKINKTSSRPSGLLSPNFLSHNSHTHQGHKSTLSQQAKLHTSLDVTSLQEQVTADREQKNRSHLGVVSTGVKRHEKNDIVRDILMNKNRGLFIHQNWHYIKLRKMNLVQSVFDTSLTIQPNNESTKDFNFHTESDEVQVDSPKGNQSNFRLPNIRPGKKTGLRVSQVMKSPLSNSVWTTHGKSIDPAKLGTDPSLDNLTITLNTQSGTQNGREVKHSHKFLRKPAASPALGFGASGSYESSSSKHHLPNSSIESGRDQNLIISQDNFNQSAFMRASGGDWAGVGQQSGFMRIEQSDPTERGGGQQ